VDWDKNKKQNKSELKKIKVKQYKIEYRFYGRWKMQEDRFSK